MIGPDFTTAEAEFLLKATESAVLGRPRLTLAVDTGHLVAKLLELKKQATAIHAGRVRYLEVLNAEDAKHEQV